MTEFFQNAAWIDVHGGLYTPRRFSPQQMAYYTAMSEAAGIRARCTAGIALAFTTTAREISFSYRADAFSRSPVGFDIYENGRLTRHFDEPDRSPGGHIAYCRMEKGLGRIEIYLSGLCEISIADPDFGDASPIAPGLPKLLFLGDSITQGMTAKSPSLTYPTLYARHSGASVLNQGVGGMRFDPAHLNRMPPFSPDHIFVAYGINDLRHAQQYDLTAPLKRAELYLEKLRSLYPAVGRTVITPVWTSQLQTDPAFAAGYADYCAELASLARLFGFQVADGSRLIPHDERYFVDGLHPNEFGHTLYALNLLDGKNRIQ